MSQACNTMIDIRDPLLEQLKNREIEVGSAAFFRAYGEGMFLMADVELQQDDVYASRIEQVLLKLREARTHYMQVLSIIESNRIRPEYIDWLKGLDYDRLHRERVAEKALPDETVVWESVVRPNRERSDAVESFRCAFLARLDELLFHAEQVAATVREGSPYTGVSPVPMAFWRLQTMFSETMLAGQAIAVINALRPGDREWTANKEVAPATLA